MGRPAKYVWDEILAKEGATWCFAYEDRALIRASLAQWSRLRGKKVKTKRTLHTDPDGNRSSFMLEVTLVG